ncbi:hypothetical protein B0H13DRAFT_1026471 [Mycena leptocephala]|nr:hypothetical protein B0H13DRAFT_1026471 [Mycena leptocephala]
MKQEVAECPILLRISGMWLLAGSSNLRLLPHLLDVPWETVRAALCRLRPVTGDRGLWGLVDFARKVWELSGRDASRVGLSLDFAWSCLRVRKLINSGCLPEDLWNERIEWGRLIRICPPSPELLKGVREFVPPPIRSDTWYLHQEMECYDVIQWLKKFPEPPVDEISRWQKLFCNEWERATKRPAFSPPADYGLRWQRWAAKYPEWILVSHQVDFLT